MKNRLSDLGVEESSFKYDKKQTLVDKVFQLENQSKKVSKCPPKAKPKAVSKLMKSASESDLGTPPRKGSSSTSKRAFCLTPNQNETKKRKSEEERGRKKTQKAPPNAAKNAQNRGGIRHGSLSRSASRSPGRSGMTKSSSLFDLKDRGTPVRQGPKSLFDTPKKDEMKKSNEDKRLEFIRKQKENEEKLHKKKEEQEAERLRKNKENEEKRLKVKVSFFSLFFSKISFRSVRHGPVRSFK